ncbi:CD209 antigen-like protein A isoform X1 [Labeo rohita]|uniref:CD209 antigen-like protein A isoform X1 n=1 Tax=Labeo rohita TaxID=84645 RepID=UPI0021E2149A|nr:CD209 antigen-like protein A isoform X1 [Labeo rohita]
MQHLMFNTNKMNASNYCNMNIPGIHMMNGENEEMIYANTGPVNSLDVRTETEKSFTKSHQTPQHTGSHWMGSSRAVTVCLAVLCVLLLTAVIVLGVKCNKNTEETHQLLNKEERDGLSNNCELIKQRENMDGWVCHQSSLYFISSELKNWIESRTYCTEKGADLISINSSEEQDFIKKVPGDTGVWIGLSDLNVEDTWKWVDGSRVTFKFWRSGEPNGYTKENCVLSYATGWIDHRCHEAFKWICEKNI